MDEEEDHKDKGGEVVSCLEELIPLVPVFSHKGQSTVSKLSSIHHGKTDLIQGIDIKVKYACGTKAATPVQYENIVSHISTIIPMR